MMNINGKYVEISKRSAFFLACVKILLNIAIFYVNGTVEQEVSTILLKIGLQEN